jgi:hypothetical protein
MVLEMREFSTIKAQYTAAIAIIIEAEILVSLLILR